MRTIDADELKKCVLKWLPKDPCGREEKEMPFETDICVSMLMEIDEQPTIQPEQQWIPVTKRPPEPRIDVWCNSDLGQMVGYYDETIETWFGRDYLELLVNAWMPLPEPYKEGEENV